MTADPNTQSAPMPAPVPWVVQIESTREHGDDDVMHPEPPDIVWAADEDGAVSLAGEDRDYDTNLLSVRPARPQDFPTPAPVTEPEGGWDFVDIANRAQLVTGRSIWPDTVKAILDAAHAPCPEPVTASPGRGAVEALAWVFMRDRWFTGLDEERDKAHCDHMISNYGATWSPWQAALRDARAVLAAGYALPAADRRARDEGTVREEIAQEIKAEHDKRREMFDPHHNHDRGVLYGLDVARRIVRGGSQ